MPHAEEITRALPDGRLVVVPSATHWLPMERPDDLAPHVRDFLAEHSLAD
jgi:pimeloyl-ACP methyl ester carboxylesterase